MRCEFKLFMSGLRQRKLIKPYKCSLFCRKDHPSIRGALAAFIVWVSFCGLCLVNLQLPCKETLKMELSLLLRGVMLISNIL